MEDVKVKVEQDSDGEMDASEETQPFIPVFIKSEILASMVPGIGSFTDSSYMATINMSDTIVKQEQQTEEMEQQPRYVFGFMGADTKSSNFGTARGQSPVAGVSEPQEPMAQDTPGMPSGSCQDEGTSSAELDTAEEEKIRPANPVLCDFEPETAGESVRADRGRRAPSMTAAGRCHTAKGSAIWEHFFKVNALKSNCKHCQRGLSTKFGCTSTLAKHLEAKHTHQYAIFLRERRKRMARREEALVVNAVASEGRCGDKPSEAPRAMAVPQQDKLPENHRSARKITRKITEWIARDLQPPSIVKEDGFIQLMHEARPDFKIPCERVFSTVLLPKLQTEVKECVQLKLREVASKAKSLCFTYNVWTSRSNNSYLSLRCQFMTDDFDIESCCLGVAPFTGVPSMDDTYKLIISLITQWDSLTDLERRVPVFLLTENVGGYVEAMRNRDNWQAVSCFTCIIQLVVADAKKTNESEVIEKILSAVTRCNHLPQASSRPREHRVAPLLAPRSLPEEVPRTWAAEHDMLRRVCEHKDAVLGMLGDAELLSPAEWRVVGGLVEVLEPFSEATGDACPRTRSVIIPLVNQLRENLLAFARDWSNHAYAVGLAKILEEALVARFPLFDGDKVDCLSMMLDPRFKDRTLDTTASRINARMILEREVAEVNIAEMSNFGREQRQGFPQRRSSSLWTSFDKRALQEHASTQGGRESPSSQQEVSAFMSEPILPRANDPLAWWKTNKDRFPSLAKVAKCYLPIPAVQAASECQFSAGSRSFASKRQNLTQYNTEMLVFLSENLR